MRSAALALHWLAIGALLAGCSRAAPLSLPGEFAYEASLATDGRQLIAAWNGGKAGNAIWIRNVGDGRPVGAPIQLTDGSSNAYEPDIQLLDGDVLVAWYDKDAHSGAMTAQLARFTLQGQARWRIALSAPQALGRNPLVRVDGGLALVAWIETPATGEPALWTARVRPDGTFAQSPQRRAAVGTETWNLNAAARNGTFYVVYDARLGTRAKELHLLAAGANTAEEHLLTHDDGHDSLYPDLSLADGHAAMTWFDVRDGNPEIYLVVGEGADPAVLNESRAVRLTHSPGESSGAYLAWNGARLGVAWCDDVEGQAEIFMQDFDAAGAALHPARRVTHTDTQSSIPAIRPWGEGFVLAWNEYASTQADGHTAITTSTAFMQRLP